MDYYARKNGNDKEDLIHHLIRTGELCEEFASKFNNGKAGKILGLNHDLGKHTLKFLDVLNGKRNKVDHAIIGAWIVSNFGNMNSFLGEIIAAHHSELRHGTDACLKGPITNNQLDFNKDFHTNDKNKEMSVSSQQEFMDILNYVKQNNIETQVAKDEIFDVVNMTNNRKMFYTRMLYSCLVDADYCASAEFENPNYLKETTGDFIPFETIEQNLINYRNNIIKNSTANPKMNDLRNQVFENCSEIGKKGTDVYTLTAPTGTAKTLALLEFALQNAIHNKKERIIIVLPQLSIINQNVKIYKEICGENIVLEDDSNVEFTEKTRVYSERWSSQIIVTTSVKFFETLFKAKSTQCRKLHHVSNAEIIFDEAHTLPSNLLGYTLEIIHELSERYNTTVLFSTASPLNFNYRKDIDWNPIEVIQDVNKLYKDYAMLKNLKIKYNLSPVTYSELCSFITQNNACFIFNTKKQATHMYNKLILEYGEENCYLITTSLCSQHRLDLISEITMKLKSNQRVFVSATQCIEIGVDLDFIQVFKHLSPLPSIIQSAGRNDRNCHGNGEFVVFIIYDEELIGDGKNYPGEEYLNSAMKVKMMLEKHEEFLDLNDLSILDEYSRIIYNTITSEKDKKELRDAIDEQNYHNTSEEYKLIQNNSVSVIVPYKNTINEYRKIKNEIDKNDGCVTKNIMKHCQKFTVNSYDKKNVERYCEQLYVMINGNKEPVNYFLVDENTNIYDDNFGLNFEDITAFVI